MTVILLSGCSNSDKNEESFFGSLFTLDFLPSGMNVIYNGPLNENIAIENTLLKKSINDERTGFVKKIFLKIINIPFLLINYLLMLIINIIDFIIWFFSWIPGYRHLIKSITKAHDIDNYNVRGIIASHFSNHRNFFTHSILNPIIFIYIVIAIIIKQIKSFAVSFLISLPLLGFLGGLLADTMPNGWTQNLSRIHLFSITFNPFFHGYGYS